MANRRNKYLGGGGGTLAAFVWAAYSNFTTAKDLPSDAGWLAKMLADPPVYAPWLLLVCCVAFLAWVFWHRDDPDEKVDGAPVTQNTGGDGSHAIVNHGTINMGSAPAAMQAEKQAVAPYDIGRLNAGLERVLIGDTTLPRDMRLIEVGEHVRDVKSHKREDETNLEIADVVVERGLHLWGRYSGNPREPIPKTLHRTLQFRYTLDFVTTLGLHSVRRTFWEDVLFNRAEVEAVWPKPLRTTNDGKP